jgi:hypothetical protein
MQTALRRRRYIAHAWLAAALLLCVALLLGPPGVGRFWPACPVHALLGFDCPGCGATRALAALLRGHLGVALRLNALFVLLLPLAAAAALEAYRRAVCPGVFRWPAPPAPTLYATLAAAVLFTFARNMVR